MATVQVGGHLDARVAIDFEGEMMGREERDRGEVNVMGGYYMGAAATGSTRKPRAVDASIGDLSSGELNVGTRIDGSAVPSYSSTDTKVSTVPRMANSPTSAMSSSSARDHENARSPNSRTERGQSQDIEIDRSNPSKTLVDDGHEKGSSAITTRLMTPVPEFSSGSDLSSLSSLDTISSDSKLLFPSRPSTTHQAFPTTAPVAQRQQTLSLPSDILADSLSCPGLSDPLEAQALSQLAEANLANTSRLPISRPGKDVFIPEYKQRLPSSTSDESAGARSNLFVPTGEVRNGRRQFAEADWRGMRWTGKVKKNGERVYVPIYDEESGGGEKERGEKGESQAVKEARECATQ